MKVNVMGTSCTWFTRNNTSFVIDDEMFLDVPEGSYKNLIQVADLEKLKCVFISHMHSDHFLDLHIIITQVMRFPGARAKKLRIYGPKGLLDKIIALNTLLYGAPDEVSKESLCKNIEYIDLEDGMKISEGEYTITAYKMEHGAPETYGFTFEDKKGTVVGFPTDTAMCENLHKILKASKYAFLELSANSKHNTHICVDEYIELVKMYDKTKIFTVHTNDKTQKLVEENSEFNALHDFEVLNLD